jgi:PKD repeat protein
MFTSTIRKSITIAAAVMAVAPQLASALPPGNGGNGEPLNEPPVARFSITPNPALANHEPVIKARTVSFPGGAPGRFGSGDLVKFNAAASTDDSGIDKYSWDLDGNGTYEVSGATKTTSRTYNTPGTYQVHLKVTDSDGATDVLTHTLIIHEPPHAQVAADNATVLVGQTVNYSAAGSSDDNGIAKYEWDLNGDGTFEIDSGTTPSASSSYTTIGDRTVTLRVTDIYGAKSTAAVHVLVHRAPTAAFTIAPSPAVAGDQVTFDGSSSSDDGKIANYEWDLDGDGTFETSTMGVPTVKKAFDTPGTFTVRLRVTDDHGVQDAVTHTLTVDPKPTTTGSTTTTTTDTTAPIVRITPRSAKLRKAGFVVIRVTCPQGESTCGGRLNLRSLRGAQSSALGGAKFTVGGGQTATLRIRLSKANRRAIQHGKRLRAQATARATDAAGNTGTSRVQVVIHR